MAAAFRSESHAINTLASGGGTMTEPAGAASGDVLVCLALLDNTGTITLGTPSGWTTQETGSSGSFRWWVGTIVRGGSAPNLAFSWTGAWYHEIFIIAVSGVDGTTPVDAFATTGVVSAVNPDPPSATPTGGRTDDFAVCGGVNWSGSASGGWGAPSGYTIRSNNGAGNDGVMATKQLASSSAENPAAFTNGGGGSQQTNGFTLLLRTAAGGTTPVSATRDILYDRQNTVSATRDILYDRGLSFPGSVALVDDFNRSDSNINTGAGSTIWTGSRIQDTSGGAAIASNQFAVLGNGAGCLTLNSYGPDLDLVVDVPGLPGAANYLAIWWDVQNPATSSFTAYALVLIQGSPWTWQFRKYISGSNAGTIASGTSALTAGDSIGIRQSGTSVSFYRKTGGTWSTVMSAVADTSITNVAGPLAFEFGDYGNTRLDNLYVTATGGLSSVSATRSLLYDRLATVSATRDLLYDRIATVSATRVIAYDCVNTLAATRVILYDRVATVSATRDIRYDRGNQVSATRVIAYDRGTVVSSPTRGRRAGNRRAGYGR